MKNCEAPAHRKKKVVVPEEGTLMVKVPKRDLAFIDPSIPVSRLSSGYTDEKLANAIQGCTYWRAVLEANSGGEELVDPAGFTNSVHFTPVKGSGEDSYPVGNHQVNPEAFRRAEENLRTPGKSIASFVTEDATEFAFQSFADAEDTDALEVGRIATIGEANEAIQLLADAVMKTDEALTHLGRLHNFHEQRVVGAFEEHDKRSTASRRTMQYLNAQVGKDPGCWEGNSVWDSLGVLKDAIDAINQYKVELLEEARATRKVTDALEEEAELAFQQIALNFEHQESVIQDLTKRVPALGARKMGAGLFPPGPVPGAPQQTPPNRDFSSEIAQLDAKIVQLHGLLASYGPSSGGVPIPVANTGQAALITQLTQRVDLAESKLRRLETSVSDSTTFSTSSLSFGNVGETITFVQNTGMNQVGLVYDPFSYFVLMIKAPLSGHDHAKNQVNAVATSRRPNDSNMLATFSHVLPSYFFGKTATSSELVGKDSGFGFRLSTNAKFEANSDSEKNTILTFLSELRTATKGDLDTTLVHHKLIEDMNTMVHEQCIRLLDFMSVTYRSYTTSCRFTPEAAWKLVGRLVRCFFEDLRRVRARAAHISELNAQTLGRYFWTMMQSLNRAQEYLDLNWAHPNMMREVQEFQLEHRADASQLGAVTSDLAVIKTQARDLKVSVEKAAASVVTHSQRLGNLDAQMKLKKNKD